MVTVYTNNHARGLLCLWELDDDQRRIVRQDMDWIDDDSEQFFVYKGELYCLSMFAAVHNRFWNPNPPEWMKPFDGYLNDSFFSGILIRYPADDCGDTDTEHVVVATFY